MADLTEVQASQAVKLAGANPSTGQEDNFAEVDTLGNLKVSPTQEGPVTPGTVALKSALAGGQFNTTLPTLTNTQQAALQVDAAGRLITKPGTAGPVTPGTVATFSDLAGGQYNSSAPTLTTGQQAALQLDSAGNLKVNVPSIPTPSFTNKLRVEIDTTTKSLASTTTYTTIYTYTGSGLFIGWNGEFAANRVDFRIIIDGTETIINTTSIIAGGLASTVSNASRWQNGSGIQANSGTIDVSFRYPIKFNTSILIEARLTSGAAMNFQQGVMYIEKDT